MRGTLSDGTATTAFWSWCNAGEYPLAVVNLLPPPEPASLDAVVDIDPDTLNLNSTGKWITCYIELPAGYSAEMVDGETVTLEGVPAHIGEEGWAKWFATAGNTTDRDGDGLPERMVKFDRAAVQALLEPGEVAVVVAGELADETPFSGADVIRVIARGAKKE